MGNMSISPLFKIRVEQDIEKCDGQRVVNGSEGLYTEIANRYRTLIDKSIFYLAEFIFDKTLPK